MRAFFKLVTMSSEEVLCLADQMTSKAKPAGYVGAKRTCSNIAQGLKKENASETPEFGWLLSSVEDLVLCPAEKGR